MNQSSRIRFAIVIAAFAVLLALLPGTLQSAPGFQAIQQWTSTTTLPEPYIPRAVVGIYGGQRYIYLVGGKNAAGSAIVTVRRAAITGDGSLSGWQNTTPLPVALYSHAVVASSDGRFLYVLGGWQNTTRVKTVYRAEVGANGLLGGWATLTPLPEEIAQQAAVLVGNRIYMIGGQNTNDTHNKVTTTTIRTDGSLSGWISVTSLPRPVERLSAVVINGSIYVTGGSDGRTTGGAFDTVYYSKINSNGTLAGWQTTQLPEPLYYHQSVVQNGRLFVLGGTTDETTGRAQVWSSAINAGGWLDGWRAEPALPKALYRMAAVSVPINGLDTIYVLGGLQGLAYQSSVYRSVLAPTPTWTPTATWTLTPTKTPTPTSVATPGVSSLNLRNDPYTQVQVGGQILYTISYRNGPIGITQFDIVNTIPQLTSLVTGSISNGGTSTGSGAGSVVRWRLGSLAANATGYVTYSVKTSALESPGDVAAGALISGTVSAEAVAPEAVIVNAGATASWIYGSTTDQMTSNVVVNPSKRRFLPIVTR